MCLCASLFLPLFQGFLGAGSFLPLEATGMVMILSMVATSRLLLQKQLEARISKTSVLHAKINTQDEWNSGSHLSQLPRDFWGLSSKDQAQAWCCVCPHTAACRWWQAPTGLWLWRLPTDAMSCHVPSTQCSTILT